jgi:hypothetical protein
MAWGKIRASSVLLTGLAFSVAAQAQPIDRHNGRYIEVTYSTNETLSQSVAHVAFASTIPKSREAQISQRDLFSLMILLSLHNKHPQ